jgi:HlyD family secretion protein
MKNWKKIALIAGVVVILLAIVGFTLQQSRKGVVTVQTGKVVREDIAATVTASGEIKPKVQVNIGSNAFAKITHLYVKEGDRVKKGQMLAMLDNVQPSADVSANDSALNASRTDAVAAQATVNTEAADLKSAQAELEHAKLDYDRNKALYDAQLIAKSDFDTKKAAYDTAAAQVGMVTAKLAQAKATMDSARGHISQNSAMLRHAADVLSKTQYEAPFDGVITNVPVREGETVVPGIQNSPGSTLMTIAVTIDAIPKQKFKGVVTEIGRNALLRSTGVSTAQTISSGQEAKDFKVVVALQDPPADLLPGLSATARITTAKRSSALAIPIQALTIREKGELTPANKGKSSSVQAAAPSGGNPKEELQGVFILKNKKDAVFVPVATGISGPTDIEVTDGLKEGDEIVTGSYKVLRTLRNGASVKVDNVTKPKEEES